MQLLNESYGRPTPEDVVNFTLLFPCQNNLVTFALPLLELLPGVLPFVLFSSFNGLEFLLLNLIRLLDNLWKMSVTLDTSYLGLLSMLVDDFTKCIRYE